MAATRPVLECWHHVAGRLKGAPLIALFLDFDGTLVDLRPKPEQVSVDDRTRLALAALARSRGFRIWIVSGRRQADVRERVGLPGIRYLGLYGWEARGDEGLCEETRRALECVSAWMGALQFMLGAALAPLAGLGGQGAATLAGVLTGALCVAALGSQVLLTRGH